MVNPSSSNRAAAYAQGIPFCALSSNVRPGTPGNKVSTACFDREVCTCEQYGPILHLEQTFFEGAFPHTKQSSETGDCSLSTRP